MPISVDKNFNCRCIVFLDPFLFSDNLSATRQEIKKMNVEIWISSFGSKLLLSSLIQQVELEQSNGNAWQLKSTGKQYLLNK